ENQMSRISTRWRQATRKAEADGSGGAASRRRRERSARGMEDRGGGEGGSAKNRGFWGVERQLRGEESGSQDRMQVVGWCDAGRRSRRHERRFVVAGAVRSLAGARRVHRLGVAVVVLSGEEIVREADVLAAAAVSSGRPAKRDHQHHEQACS